jgi:hypothetical protein
LDNQIGFIGPEAPNAKRHGREKAAWMLAKEKNRSAFRRSILRKQIKTLKSSRQVSDGGPFGDSPRFSGALDEVGHGFAVDVRHCRAVAGDVVPRASEFAKDELLKGNP